MSYYFDWLGNPISALEWAELFEDERHLGEDVLDGGDVTVSTVYIGLDHGLGLSGRPLIFETMVFGGEYDQWTWRYASEREARQGHEHVVAALRAHHLPSPTG